jgi:hypothetical protein
MAKGEEEADRHGPLSFLHQLAGHVVDGRDVIGVEGVPQTETVSEHRRSQKMVALTLQATSAPAQDAASIELPTVEVTAESQTSNATANGAAPAPPSAGIGASPDMNEAASAFTVTGQQVNQRIFSRPAEALEIVPGLVITTAATARPTNISCAALTSITGPISPFSWTACR